MKLHLTLALCLSLIAPFALSDEKAAWPISIEQVEKQINGVRKAKNAPDRVVEGRYFKNNYFRVHADTRFENCTFYDAQIRVEGIGDVQFVACRFIASSVYLRDAFEIDVIDCDFHGQFTHDLEDKDLPNNQIGPSGCIRTDGQIENILVANNRFVGVLRAWHSQLNTGNVSDVTFANNLYSGLVRDHADTNRGECILFHTGGNDKARVDRIASYHDTWDRWCPVDPKGDMLPPEIDKNPWNFNAGKKPIVDFHYVNAADIYLYRPTLGKYDTLRFSAPEGGKIRRITIQDAITDGAGISRVGDVQNIKRTKIGLGGGEIPIID